jgi:hypothetical protein
VAPRIRVDIEDVAVLGEAIDEADARGVVEDGAPLVEGEVGGNHDGPRLVASADDVK